MTFSKTRQNRLARVGNFRALASDESPNRFIATVMRYDTVDDYQTEFAPDVFGESLRQRMPRIVWGHDWTDPIGRWLEWTNVRDESGIRLDMIGEFDDFEAVPRARQAYAQLKSGTIDQFSVGFVPDDGEMVLKDGEEVLRFTRARLDEVSLVLVGAVPGTQLLAVRNRPIIVQRAEMVISKDLAASVLLDLHAGKVDLVDALNTIKAAQVPHEPAEPTTDSGTSPTPDTPVSEDGGPPPSESSTPGELDPPAPEPEPEVTPEPEPEPEVTPVVDIFETEAELFDEVDGILQSLSL